MPPDDSPEGRAARSAGRGPPGTGTGTGTGTAPPRGRWRARLARIGAAVVALAALAAGGFIVVAAPMLTGFVAKAMCSGVFVQGRSAAAVAAQDLDAYSTRALFALVAREVDPGAGRVEARLGPVGSARAVHRPGLGCTLSPDRAPAPLTTAPRRVAERYADGFGLAVPMPGWSMAKSVTAVLVGRAVAEGRLVPDAPLPIDTWPAGDARRAIRWRDALAMSDGLAFSEDYGNPVSDATQMLFVRAGAGEYAAGRPLAHPPGTRWAYSSGTTNLVSLALSRALGDAYALWPHTQLFAPLGMASAVFEPDARGVYVGSSFLYATARDWARFGLFVLRDGRWQGQRLLPEGWVHWMRSPGPASERYGAHWWRVEPAAGTSAALPAGAFQATGHAGQRLTIVPSHDLVIVRLGQTLDTRRLRHLDLVTATMRAVGPNPEGDTIR